jgi:hypothetical protein
MPSPFPGMDPYIESSSRWGDFHGSMIAAIRNDLNTRLPEGYVASMELYVWFHEPEASQERQQLEPDVYVVKKGRRSKVKAGSLSDAPPATIVLAPVERRRHKYIEITDLKSNRVVTAIELLSPANKKAGEDREAYLAKRSEFLEGKVNLVEIDLLRGGRRMPLSDPPPEMGDYYVMICRAWQYPRAGFWSFTVRDPLPEVPVPLSKGQPAVKLPLRPCMDQAYDGGRYSTLLDYGEPLKPCLRKEDADWVRELLDERSGRSES